MKVLYNLLIGDHLTLIWVLVTALISWLVVRLGAPTLAAFLLLLGLVLTMINTTYRKLR